MPILDLDRFSAGDAIATHCTSWKGRLVQVLSGYLDHLSILAHHPTTGRLCVYEAEFGEASCLVTHKKRAGFRCRPLETWIRANQSGGCEVWHIPLATPLPAYGQRALAKYLARWCRDKIPYDLGGAIRARTFGGRWATRWLIPCKQDASTLFCAEAVAVAWQELKLITIPNTAAYGPSGLVALALKQGAVLRPRLVEAA